MGPFSWFLFVYTFGGLTFIPLLLGLILLHAYLTFPEWKEAEQTLVSDDPANLKHADDSKLVLKTATDTLEEQFHRKHESDVAAGYFAVCREYVPGGVNGRPPDRLSPAGEVVATESPSVYQSMYRSIFDRSQKPTIEPNKDSNGKSVKRANNVFYVVLRLGHLMLYEDIQQLEVRYVISLQYHEVDLFSGGEEIPEGELWIKRNAIRLRMKPSAIGLRKPTMPFFLFSENMSEKEDFYFAILNNQEKNKEDSPPEPQHFEVKHIVGLVQKLHSSEEHLQTRWLNAIVGRLFLAMYKTPELENLIRTKLTKKISRVKKPAFITKLALQKIEPGEAGPFITNPRLKDLTVNGDCTIEADINYAGNFRIEIAATARIELGSRFKAREVDMVLAVTCKKAEGHVLLRIKPPPSNRLWYTFETMPKIDMTIEPVVSSRQITYTVVLKAIESRIREVIAETICLPFWDDAPFLDSSTERFRGGIWKKAQAPKSTEIKTEDPDDEAEAGGEGPQAAPPESLKPLDERIMSMPLLPGVRDPVKSRHGRRSATSLGEALGLGSSTAVERSSRAEIPRALRSPSIPSAANPMVSPSYADVKRDADASQKREDASTLLKDLSARSLTTSPSDSPVGSLATESSVPAAMLDRASRQGSGDSGDSQIVDPSSRASMSSQMPSDPSFSSTPTTSSLNLKEPSINEEARHNKSFAATAKSFTSGDRKQALATLSAATMAAQKWGMGVLANKRAKEHAAEETGDSRESTPRVMGGGRPLPPIGIPLPPPEKQTTKGLSFALSKRKPLPPPLLPKRSEQPPTNTETPSPPLAKPQLPERRRRQSAMQVAEDPADDVLIVEAPTESAPTSPLPNEHHDEFFGHGEDDDSLGLEAPNEPEVKPELPARTPSQRTARSALPSPLQDQAGQGAEGGL